MAWNPFKRKSDGFQRALKVAAQRAGVELAQVADEAVMLVDGQRSRVSLHSLRIRAKNIEDKDLPDVLERFVDAVRKSMQEDRRAQEVLDRIRPCLLPRVAFPGHRDGDDDEPAHVELFPGFASTYLVANEDGETWYLQDHHIADWDVTFEQLYPVAVANLAARTSREMLHPLAGSPVPGVFAYDSGDSFDAARILLLEELLSPLPEHGVVVMVPSQDTLLCAPLHNVEAVGAMNAMLVLGRAMNKGSPSAITDQPFWYDGETWQHIPVVHRRGDVEVKPPDRFMRALEKLAKQSAKRLPGT